VGPLSVSQATSALRELTWSLPNNTGKAEFSVCLQRSGER